MCLNTLPSFVGMLLFSLLNRFQCLEEPAASISRVEDTGNRFLQNVSTYLPSCTGSQTRRLYLALIFALIIFPFNWPVCSQTRREEAEKNRSLDVLRAAVVCVLGHVDTGESVHLHVQY
jgi:hypothetical protein